MDIYYVRGNDPQNIPPPSDIVSIYAAVPKIVAPFEKNGEAYRVVLTTDLDVFANACVHKIMFM